MQPEVRRKGFQVLILRQLIAQLLACSVRSGEPGSSLLSARLEWAGPLGPIIASCHTWTPAVVALDWPPEPMGVLGTCKSSACMSIPMRLGAETATYRQASCTRARHARTQDAPGLVRPAARHVVDFVAAAAQHQHGHAELEHELLAVGVALQGQVERAQPVARQRVRACAATPASPLPFRGQRSDALLGRLLGPVHFCVILCA